MPLALLVDDDPEVLVPFADLIAQQGFETEVASTVADARALLKTKVPDVLLVDLILPDGNGMDLLADLEATTQVVLITGHATVDTAVEALRLGVSDSLTTPIDIARLKAVLSHVFRARQLSEEIGTLRRQLRSLGRFGHLVGASTAMQRVYDLIARVAPTEATVLLTGASGTAKQVVAQTLHQL